MNYKQMIRKPNPKNTMLVPLLAAVMLVGFVLSPVYGQATTTTETLSEPFTATFFSCANGQQGELVQVSGTVYSVIHTTLDDRGGFHLIRHGNLVASGTGIESGTQYQITAISNSQNNGRVGAENTFVDYFRIIGQGPLNNLLVHHNFHVTVTPDGEVTASVNHFTSECR
jgi:hypothetical protein